MPPTLDPEAVLELAHHHLGLIESVFYAPAIPTDKESTLRALHPTLAPDEPILVLYDDTVFGGAKDGFALTPERICWRFLGFDPQQVRWQDLQPSSVALSDGSVVVADQKLSLVLMDQQFHGAVVAMLQELTRRARGVHPFRAQDVSVQRVRLLSEQRVLELARLHLSGQDAAYFHPQIPARKLANVRRLHALHLPPDEVVLVLHDNTAFGGAKDGFLITRSRLCWRNFMESPRYVEWRYLDPETISTSDSWKVELGGGAIGVSGVGQVAHGAAELLRALCQEMRALTPYR